MTLPRDVTTTATTFYIKDSGKRAEFDGGMVRDTAEGKVRPDLVRDGPMFWRWIMHLTKGAEKYEARNWLKGVGNSDVLERAYESVDRHYEQWRRGDTDEDHAAAVFFNINQIETHKEAAEDAEQSRPKHGPAASDWPHDRGDTKSGRRPGNIDGA